MAMSVQKILPVILAGGSGTRLWPASRSKFPKQFLRLGGQESLFQGTIRRLEGFAAYEAPLVLTVDEYRFLVTEQFLSIGAQCQDVLLEPAARNTAPALIAAALFAEQKVGPTIVHIMPSDHVIDAGEAYWRAVEGAAIAAEKGALVTFGIEPDHPNTGYGYIRVGERLSGETPEGAEPAFRVDGFVEKPDAEKAELLLKRGGHYWNAGLFLFRTDVFLEEARRLEPEMVQAVERAVQEAERDLDFVRLASEPFEQAPANSVDYAIFERTEKAAVVPCSFSWSDLGSWQAVWDNSEKDAKGNSVTGSATVIGCEDTLVVSDGPHIAAQGLEDISIIASADTVYVGRLSQSQEVRSIVAALKTNEKTRPLADIHRTVYRPWGSFTNILTSDRFQVKQLEVKPQQKLSLQRHYHRAEHWIVVKGTAEVTIGEKVFNLYENQSTFIPMGEVHRLANPGKVPLRIIEVQSGSYLGEDDIVRYSDDFGRN